jgi:predicted TIM-barrel enzyme
MREGSTGRNVVSNAASRPVVYALLVATSFIGVEWLTQPLGARFGFTEPSRSHLTIVAAFVGVGVTWASRVWGSTSTARPVN